MKPITAADPQSRSADLLADNVARLRKLFPEAFTEGKIDFDVIKQLLGGEVDDREEKYGLNWHGKRLARRLALIPSTGTLRPASGEGVADTASQNIMIEGENLEVLKLLQKSFSGKVKLIYIDPPYNTGKDFVYSDDFRDSIGNYKRITGQVDDGGNALTSNPETSGRFHTAWLNMMYPRLKLARNLLREDGVIAVSIADDEVHHLKTLLSEVFGEENAIATCVWQKRYSRENRGIIGDVHDYIVFWARHLDCGLPICRLLPLTEDQAAVYKNPNNDPKGRWRGIPMTAQGTRTNQQYTIITPGGAAHTPPPGRCWSTIESEYLRLKSLNRIWYGADGMGQPNIIRYLSEVEGLVPWTWWPHEEVGHTDESKKEVMDLFDNSVVFDTPKPLRLLRRILQIATHADDIVLDFFAGSGTTGHAVMAQNAEDGGNRRYILVQLPESLDPNDKDQKAAADFCEKIGKPLNLAELTKERLRRASERVKNDNPAFTGDLGFRAYKLDTSNIRAWNPNASDIGKSLFDTVDHLEADRSEVDILTELLLKLGLDLCVPIDKKPIAGSMVYSIGGGVLLVCLATKITAKQVEPLAQGIVAWHKEQNPAGESQVVFRDSAFDNDVAKTNMTAILAQHGLTNVRSL